jgi:xylulokinase
LDQAVSALVLAIDLGTSGPKVGLVDDHAQVIAHAATGTTLRLEPGGGAEQDPNEWWRAIVAATQMLHEASGVDSGDVVAVAVTAQWTSTVPTAADGSPAGPALLWMDSRGSAYVEEIIGGHPKVVGYNARRLAEFLRLTGGIPGHSGRDPSAQILWLQRERPDVVARTRWFLEPGDWLTLQLTGRAVSSVDSAAILWVVDVRDLRRARYDDRLLSWSRLRREQLPELVPSCSVVGPLRSAQADELGLPVGIPVVTASGDLHATLVGSGAVGAYEPHLYLGTSAWLSCHVPWKRTDVLRNQTAMPSAVPGRYLVANEHQTAGACLAWLHERVAPADDLAVFVREAEESAAGSGGVVFTPWLNGSRTPVDDRTVRAGFHNLSLGTSRPDLVRSVLEGVAYDSRWLHESVRKFVRRPLPVVDLVGGGAISDIWCQIHADVLGVTVRQRAEPRLAGVRGAGMLALLATRRVEQIGALASQVPVRAVYAPNRAHRATYDALYREFRALYRRTKSVYRRLNSARPR